MQECSGYAIQAKLKYLNRDKSQACVKKINLQFKTTDKSMLKR